MTKFVFALLAGLTMGSAVMADEIPSQPVNQQASFATDNGKIVTREIARRRHRRRHRRHRRHRRW